MIIAGDFNLTPGRAASEAILHRLKLAQDSNEEFVTHINSRDNSRNNQLDYIMTNQPFENTMVEDIWTDSDHRPLKTTLRLNLTRRLPRQPNAPCIRLKTNLTIRE